MYKICSEELFVILNKEKKDWNSHQLFSTRLYIIPNGVLSGKEFERSYIWVRTVSNSADAKMNNFPGLFRNQEINLMAFCNLGGVFTMGFATCHLIFKGKALEFSLV